MLAQHLLGLAKRFCALLPSSGEQRGDSFRRRGEARGVRAANGFSNRSGPPGNAFHSLSGASTGRGHLDRVQRQEPRDPLRFTGTERQQQAAGLEVGAANRIDHQQADAGRPTDVDLRQVFPRDIGRPALCERQTA